MIVPTLCLILCIPPSISAGEFLARSPNDTGENFVVLSESPPNVAREDTTYDWCDCGDGLGVVEFWADSGSQSQSITVKVGEIKWVKWDMAVERVKWKCGGQRRSSTSKINLNSDMWLSLAVGVETKGDAKGLLGCGKSTGRLHWNTWKETTYVSSVPFTTGTDGYFCFKIPALLRTSAGTLIAFSEARKPDCSDFAHTDLVYKRSVDGGNTWGELSLLVNPAGDRKEMGVCGHELTIGNVAPVQLRDDSQRHSGRILAPYMRNNFKTWITYSDDDGVTWTGDREIKNAGKVAEAPDCNRNMTFFGYDVDSWDRENKDEFKRFADHLCNIRESDPYTNPKWSNTLSGSWQFVGVGPPGSLQLKSGRVLVPGYHSYIRGIEGDGVLPTSQLFNNFALGHVLISDDGGDNWRLSDDWGRGQGANENQMVQLSSGQVLMNSRSLSTGSPQMRLQARSDDDGETFSASEFVDELPQPFNGCQGSTTLGANDAVYVTTPDPEPATSKLQSVADKRKCGLKLTGRTRVTLFKSEDGGFTYPHKTIVDPGLSAQTSLQYHEGRLVLLYEQADPEPVTPKQKQKQKFVENLAVLMPQRFVFRELEGKSALDLRGSRLGRGLVEV